MWCEGYVERSSFEVDHHVPRSDPAGQTLRLEWGNLFVACRSCNNGRQRKWPEGGLLNPCIPEDDPEVRLLQAWHGQQAVFSPAKPEDPAAKNTAAALDRLHNRRDVHSEDLRRAIERHLAEVWRTERDLLSTSDSVERALLGQRLRHLLSVRAPFTALARSTVKGEHRRFFSEEE
jgi:hypothetical protein